MFFPSSRWSNKRTSIFWRMASSQMLRRVALVTRATRRNISEDAILHSHRRETSNRTSISWFSAEPWRFVHNALVREQTTPFPGTGRSLPPANVCDSLTWRLCLTRRVTAQLVSYSFTLTSETALPPASSLGGRESEPRVFNRPTGEPTRIRDHASTSFLRPL
jgi:hypothetical protein